MKKVFILIAILAISFVSVNAQQKLRWGITGGMNVSSFSITGFDSRIGFHLGAKAELGLPQVTNGAYMDFGALLSLKGAQINGGSVGGLNFNPYYLEVPVHIGYKYAVNESFSLFGSAGPYLAIGLFGNASGKVNTGDDVESSEGSEPIFGEGALKRFDFGLGLKAGAEFNQKFQISIGYDWGLIETLEYTGLKNRNLMISLSYMF